MKQPREGGEKGERGKERRWRCGIKGTPDEAPELVEWLFRSMAGGPFLTAHWVSGL